MKRKLKLAFALLEQELHPITSTKELSSIVGGDTIDDIMDYYSDLGFTFQQNPDGSYYAWGPASGSGNFGSGDSGSGGFDDSGGFGDSGSMGVPLEFRHIDCSRLPAGHTGAGQMVNGCAVAAYQVFSNYLNGGNMTLDNAYERMAAFRYTGNANAPITGGQEATFYADVATNGITAGELANFLASEFPNSFTITTYDALKSGITNGRSMMATLNGGHEVVITGYYSDGLNQKVVYYDPQTDSYQQSDYSLFSNIWELGI